MRLCYIRIFFCFVFRYSFFWYNKHTNAQTHTHTHTHTHTYFTKCRHQPLAQADLCSNLYSVGIIYVSLLFYYFLCGVHANVKVYWMTHPGLNNYACMAKVTSRIYVRLWLYDKKWN
jgi:hypothetical protein